MTSYMGRAGAQAVDAGHVSVPLEASATLTAWQPESAPSESGSDRESERPAALRRKRYSPQELAKQAAKEAEWREILDDWRKSALDARSYARLKGFSEHVFYHWKRAIRLRDGAAPSRPKKKTGVRAHGKPVVAIKKRAERPLFLPVHVKAPGAIEIRHSSGHIVIIHDGCSSETLRLLLDAFERI